MSNNESTEKASEDLLKKIDTWLEWDQCEETRKEILDLKAKSKWEDLKKILFNRIEFGTAGLRSKMAAGFSQMNELTIIQTSQGLIRYIQKCFHSSTNETLSVVIGFDARHNSHRFARLVASLFLHEGFRVYLFDSKVVPTPFIPFTIQKKKCQSGIMITASHNPKDDNGYKVYWTNGAQIIPPHDIEISQSIENNLQPWKDKAWNIDIIEQKRNSFFIDPIDEITNEYMKNLSSLSYFSSLNQTSTVKFVYTPVHGVGQYYAEKAFEQFQLKPFISVDEQKNPDGNFPTVKYPNPEEGKETLECSIRTADKNQVEIILANDPDADRFAVAEKDLTNNKWNVLSGNQLGTLLGWWRWFTWRNKHPDVDPKDVFMLYSTVSSKILKSMSIIEQFQTIETLTGFKWLGNKSIELIEQNKHVLFAFEEAIGFMCDPLNVVDKDGISALVIGAEMSIYLRSIGRTLSQQLDYLSTIYGFHLNNNSYLICYQTSIIKQIFQRLRHFHCSTSSLNYPRFIDKDKVISVRDLTVAVEINFDKDENKITQPQLPCSNSTQMITFQFNNGIEITLRTSGTEPKIKWYSEIIKHVQLNKENSSKTIEQIQKSIKEELDYFIENLIEIFLEPNKNGLIRK